MWHSSMFMSLLAKRALRMGCWSLNAGIAARKAFLSFAVGSEPSQRSASGSYYPLQTSRNLIWIFRELHGYQSGGI